MNTFPSSAHLELIRKGQQSLADALPIIDAAEACGVDCTEYRQGHAELSRRLALYQSRFFPNQTGFPNEQGVPRSP